MLRNPQATFALACWQMARAGLDVPVEAEFLKQPITTMKHDMMILRVMPDGEFFYEHYGSAIAAHAGFDMTGKRVSDFVGCLRTFYSDIYGQAVTERQPLATLHRLGHFKERPLWERIILPTVADGRVTALYVVNSVRELAYDVNHLKVRSRNSGLFALQFQHDSHGNISEALIVGANQAAQAMTGRRLDQLLDKSMTECFPGIRGSGLWQRYLVVAETRQAQEFTLDYHQDGVAGRFQVIITPFLDGVSVEFSRAEAQSNDSPSLKTDDRSK